MGSGIQSRDGGRLDAGLARRDDDGVVSGLVRWGVEFIHSQSMSVITTDDGEKVRFKDCVRHILNSPAWKEFSFFEAYERYQSSDSHSSGWDRFSEFVKESSDFQGEKGARKVLGVEKDASWKDVRSAHRALALKLHPDRCTEEDCEARFTEMQAAYDLLKELEDKRKRRHERKSERHASEAESEGRQRPMPEGEKRQG